MRSAYEEPREQLMADSTHLSPVLSRSEDNEISSFQIDYKNIDNNDVHEKLREVGTVSVVFPHLQKTKQTAFSSSKNENIMYTQKLQKSAQKVQIWLTVMTVNLTCLAALRKVPLLTARLYT